MDMKKYILYGALAFLGYSLYVSWQQQFPSPTPKAVQTQSVNSQQSNAYLPTVDESKDEATVATPNSKTPAISAAATGKNTIDVRTDVLNLTIDLHNGDIIGAKLLDYPESMEQKDIPFQLMMDKGKDKYIANSSVFTTENGKVQNVDFQFSAQKSAYQMQQGQNELQVVLQGQAKNGLKATKTFTFKRGEYLIGVKYDIKNQGESPWKGYFNAQLLRTPPKSTSSGFFGISSYTGASISDPAQKNYQKVSFDDMKKNNLNRDVTGGWVALQEHYFLTAWVPEQQSQHTFYSRVVGGNEYIIGMVSPNLSIAPGQSKSVGARLFAGPELTDVLKTIAPGLNMTVDYGWLWFISMFLFWVMKNVYQIVGNWGWSIVIVTLLIKLAFYRLSAASYKSMANMRRLQPKIQALRERYGEDKAALSQKTMELYRKEKINPLGGCLPILIQIPVFIALYWVLLESVQLRQAPFILWIHDLAAPDPYGVLPILMAASMFVQQKLNPTSMDPTQAKVMMLLPVVFMVLFWNFPSGLVLYWVVNTTLSILQQWYIMKRYEHKDEKPKTKKAQKKLTAL